MTGVLRGSAGIQDAVIANEVKQSSKIKDAFCLKHLDCHIGFAFSQ
jgi:hypothetical protein